MIKQLITDIAYDNISLSQALTRSKIIESKIKNQVFKDWIKNEIEGYEDDSEIIPEYRTIPAPTNLVAEFPFGKIVPIEVLIPEDFEEKTKFNTYYHIILDSIRSLEDTIGELPGMQAQINLPVEKVSVYSILYENVVINQGGAIRSGHKLISKVHLQNIIEQTKNKLLDILMDLDTEFPNLENDFENNKTNNEAVKNIINNNFYGGQNHTNNATGTNISINSNNNFVLNEEQKKVLAEIGVKDNEVQELNEIVNSNNDSKAFSKRLLGWFGSVSSSMVARGAYDNIPKLHEFVTQFM